MFGRISTAFRAFFAAIFSDDRAKRIQRILANPQPDPPVASLPPAVTPVPKPVEPIPAKSPRLQSEAVTLLATLQREARLVDFLQEDISSYSDEQIGGAVREIHRETAAVLDRLFQIRPILEDAEGASVTIPAGFNAARYRLTGKLAGQAPFKGVLTHHGWEVTRCEIPEFMGDSTAAKTIAPAEVEIQ